LDHKDHLYADDIHIYTSCNLERYEETKKNLECLVDECVHWLLSVKLKVNQSKTEFIIYGKGNELNKITQTQFRMGSGFITAKSTVKNVGFIFDQKCKMANQIDNVVRICRFQLRKIGKIRKFLTQRTTKLLVNSTIISRIDYQNSIYYGIPNQTIRKLQMILNSSIRLIFRLNPKEYSSITSYRIRLGWLSMTLRIEYKLMIIIKKVILYGQPIYLRELLNFKKLGNYMVLRNDNEETISHRYSKNTYSDKTLEIICQKHYDNLPTEIKGINNIETFKKELHRYLINKE